MNLMLLGGIAMASLIAGLFFVRFWKNTRDRFFLFFAVSFFVEGLNRFALGMTSDPDEERTFFYIVRFLSFCLILVAIADKNWVRSYRIRSTASKGPVAPEKQ